MTEKIKNIQLQMARYKMALERGLITALEYRELTYALDLKMQYITENYPKSA